MLDSTNECNFLVWKSVVLSGEKKRGTDEKSDYEAKIDESLIKWINEILSWSAHKMCVLFVITS